MTFWKKNDAALQLLVQLCWKCSVWPDWAIYRQLGDFLKSLAIIFLTLVAQFFGDFLGDFLLKAQNLHFYAIKIFLTSKNVKIWPINAKKKLTQQIF